MGRRLLFAGILVLLMFGGAQGQDRRQNHSRLTLMTLNTEFMWDGQAPEEGQVDFAWKNSATEAEEHMQAVAQIIIRGNADIVNLAEIENQAALETLNTKFLHGRGYKTYFAKGTDTGQDMGLLTRIDPENEIIKYDSQFAVRCTNVGVTPVRIGQWIEQH